MRIRFFNTELRVVIDSLLNTRLQRRGGLPTKLLIRLRRIEQDRVSIVVGARANLDLFVQVNI